MFIDLGYSVAMTEEQFQAEMVTRRAAMKSRNDFDLGCPLCWAPPVVTPTPRPTQQQGGHSKSRGRLSLEACAAE